MNSASLLPTSERTVNSRASRPMSSRLTRGLDGDRAVGDLDVAQAELAQPGHQLLDPALADGDLGERPAEHDGDPVLGVAGELRLRLPVTSDVPQPSLTMSTLSPATSMRPSTSATDSPGRSRG